jgi:hypothetical protein
VPGPGISWIDYYLGEKGQPLTPAAREAVLGNLGGIRGAAAVYEPTGSLVHYDPTFFTGKELPAGEGGVYETHIEARVRRHFGKLDLLQKGRTVVIVLSEPKEVCKPNCFNKLNKAARLTGARFVVRSPGMPDEFFPAGSARFGAPEGAITPTRARTQTVTQGELFEVPTAPRGSGGAGRTGSVRGGGTPRGLGGAGAALGVIGFIADIYFYWKYGPCGVGYLPEEYCRDPYDPRYLA